MCREGETDGAVEEEERDRERVGSLDGGLTDLDFNEVVVFLEIFVVVVVVTWRDGSSRGVLSGSFDCCCETDLATAFEPKELYKSILQVQMSV